MKEHPACSTDIHSGPIKSLLFFTSANSEVMCLVPFIYRLVCQQITEKVTGGFGWNFGGRFDLAQFSVPDFGGDRDWHPDRGPDFSPLRGWEKDC